MNGHLRLDKSQTKFLIFYPLDLLLPQYSSWQSMAVPFLWLLRIKLWGYLFASLLTASDLQLTSKSLNCSFKLCPESQNHSLLSALPLLPYWPNHLYFLLDLFHIILSFLIHVFLPFWFSALFSMWILGNFPPVRFGLSSLPVRNFLNWFCQLLCSL